MELTRFAIKLFIRRCKANNIFLNYILFALIDTDMHIGRYYCYNVIELKRRSFGTFSMNIDTTWIF